MIIILKKKEAQWWDTLSTNKGFKRFIKTDFSKWCEEEDKEYVGQFDDPMGGMDLGGMGGMPPGMDFSSMMGGMGGMGGADFEDEDDEDDAGDIADLQPDDLPPLESSDAPPPLE